MYVNDPTLFFLATMLSEFGLLLFIHCGKRETLLGTQALTEVSILDGDDGRRPLCSGFTTIRSIEVVRLL